MDAHKNDYYHVCMVPLERGSVILPGNWGRVIRDYRDGSLGPTSMWIMLREQTFELVRVNYFPERPSRYKCAYVFSEADQARQYIVNQNLHTHIIYRAALLDQGAPTFEADLNLVSELNQGDLVLPTVEERAHMYWNGMNIQNPEVVTESRLQVFEHVSF